MLAVVLISPREPTLRSTEPQTRRDYPTTRTRRPSAIRSSWQFAHSHVVPRSLVVMALARFWPDTMTRGSITTPSVLDPNTRWAPHELGSQVPIATMVSSLRMRASSADFVGRRSVLSDLSDIGSSCRVLAHELVHNGVDSRGVYRPSCPRTWMRVVASTARVEQREPMYTLSVSSMLVHPCGMISNPLLATLGGDRFLYPALDAQIDMAATDQAEDSHE